MSLTGVIIAILLLIFLIYKHWNLIPATLIGVVVLAFTSGLSVDMLLSKHYAVFLADFIAKYFMVFVANSLFGYIMEETLLVSEFSKLIWRSFGNKNAAYGAMLITAILSYGGVSVFVIVFTVYPIFLATFQKANLPRKLIPGCIMSSSCTVPLSMLPGGAQLNNIIPISYLGTTPMAATLPGLASSLATTLFLIFYFRYEFAKARRQGEHFTVDSSIETRIANFQKESHLTSWYSVLPLVLILSLINLGGVDLAYAVFAGCALALLLGHKNLPNLLSAINNGIKNVGTATIITSVSVGFGGAVLACPGAQAILKAIAELPVNPIVSLSLASSFAGVLTGNGGGGADVAMKLLSQPYLNLGVQAPIMHRIAAIATAGCSCLPNNGMLITVMDTCGYSAKECYKYIFISTVLGSLVGLSVANLLGCCLYPTLP